MRAAGTRLSLTPPLRASLLSNSAPPPLGFQTGELIHPSPEWKAGRPRFTFAVRSEHKSSEDGGLRPPPQAPMHLADVYRWLAPLDEVLPTSCILLPLLATPMDFVAV